MSEAKHPYFMTYFESSAGHMVSTCRPVAIVVSGNPQDVTCPRCQGALQRLTAFMDMLATLDDEQAHDA